MKLFHRKLFKSIVYNYYGREKVGFLIGDLFLYLYQLPENALKEMDITVSQVRVSLVLANDGVSIDFLANKTNMGKAALPNP